jgi:transcriptional regulator of met regulon
MKLLQQPTLKKTRRSMRELQHFQVSNSLCD